MKLSLENKQETISSKQEEKFMKIIENMSFSSRVNETIES